MTLVDVEIVVNDTDVAHSQASLSRRLADSWLLSDDRFFVMFGVICGVIVVFLLASVVCVLLILRRRTTKPSSSIEPASDSADTAQRHDDSFSTALMSETRADATSPGHHYLDWNAEYTKMINVCVTLSNYFIY